MPTNPGSLDVPTPGVLYINDDLTGPIRERFGPCSEPDVLANELMRRARYDPDKVGVLTIERQLEGIVSQGPRRPFPEAIAIGGAGKTAADLIHRRTGWFPAIKKIALTRVENGEGGHDLRGADRLPQQLGRLTGSGKVAVVDDTVYSGLTAAAVLDALPDGILPHTELFCLKAVGQTAERLRAKCAVTVGFVAPGTINEDVSIINATGLVYRGAIRTRHGPDMAFFDRPEWMRAWFPADHEQLIDLCRRLNAAVSRRE